ncbi:MAG TPA: TadE/TadG family type IV pilus assembly protein [Bauldia sp.]|nr:TadE/TadG family type IV pilus assembly protein [Bauldia sp.]
MATLSPASADPALPQPTARGGFWRAGRRLRRDQNGATTVEFALIAVPFFALLFAILETGMAFFAANVLETAVTNAARLIRTGQAQEAGLDGATFKDKICDQLVLMFNCSSGLYVDVETFTDFGSITLAPPVDENGDLKKDGYVYHAGHGSDIVVVRAFYQWPVFVPQLGNNLADLGNGMHLLAAAAAFRNEPFPW